MRIFIWILKKIGNFVWKLFAGAALAFVWFVIAILLTLTIVGYPWAVKCFKIGYTSWKPFGREVVTAVERYPLGNILWVLSGGIIVGGLTVAVGLILLSSVVGLALVKQWIKVAKLSFFPFGVYIK